MKHVISIIVLLLTVSFLAGCGETFSGFGKDARRIGAGVHKVFIRESTN